jgi:hypothetical protein
MSKFPWGRVIEDETVGPYMVRSYHPTKSNGGRREVDESVTLYHGYINGKDCSESWASIDEALAGLIVRNTLDMNHRSIDTHFIAGLRAMSSM